MFRETSSQISFFQPEISYPDVLPKDDWCHIFREQVYPLIDEQMFKHLYKDSKLGAPNKSIKTMISLLIFMMLETLNWREVENMFQRRIDWMIATYTSFGEANVDFTTLFKFYCKLEADDTAYKFFKHLVQQFIELCNISVDQQRVDSFFMFGWLKILSRYGLFKETIRKFLQSLRKQKPGLYEQIKGELSQEYLEKEFDLTEKNKDKASRKIQDMINDIYRLKEAFSNHKQVKNYETFKIMCTVFEQQCVVSKGSNKDGNSSVAEKKDSSNQTSEKISKNKRKKLARKQQRKTSSSKKNANSEQSIELREKPAGDKIISNPHNTDAEYTKKRNQKVVGHKGFLTETCDPENEVQFITDGNLETSTFSDSKEIENIMERLEENDMKPKVLNGDAGFITGKTILSSESKGIDLKGPVSGRSQDIEKFDESDKKSRTLDITEFSVEIDNESNELTVINCPNGQTPIDQKRSDKTGKLLVHFSPEICSACPFQERCPVTKGKKVNTLTVSEEQYAGAKRHQEYMTNPAYRKSCAIRSGAESLVNEVANGHGCRKSRHRSEKRSRLRLFFGIISCNVKRFMRYWASSAHNQVDLTPVSP